MTDPVISEVPLVLRRTYAASRERVFRAWVEREDLERWYTPGDGWELQVVEHEARPGGKSTVIFGPAGSQTRYVEVTTYLEVSPPSKLRFTTELAEGHRAIARTACTVEFIDRGPSTEVVLTEIGYPPESLQERNQGWSETLAHLSAVVEQ